MSDIDLIEYGEMRAAVQQLTSTVASLGVCEAMIQMVSIRAKCKAIIWI